MRAMRLSVFGFIFFSNFLAAQIRRPPIVFGQISVNDFTPKSYAIDSSADAIYLFNGGYISYKSNTINNRFDIQYTHLARIRLLKRASFDDAAKIEIPIYSIGQYQEKIADFQACTYNLENGKINTIQSNKNSLSQEVVVKGKKAYLTLNKFAFPGVTEGSIIEFLYTIEYPGVNNIPSWIFQKKYPQLWNEFEITQPDYYNYLITKNGLLHFDIDSTTETFTNYGAFGDDGQAYSLSSVFDIHTPSLNHVWAMKEVGALKKEPFISSLANYEPKISFRLYSVQYQKQYVRSVIKNWNTQMADLVNDEYFGEELKDNSSVSEVIKNLQLNNFDDLKKSIVIFDYIRDNYSCIYDRNIYLSQPLKKTIETKSGSNADLNLLLTAMLSHSGLIVTPVFLRAKEDGVAPVKYPVIDDYNYLVCLLKIGQKSYFLDASKKNISFNQLPLYCYNGLAKTLDTLQQPINLSTDSISKNTQTTVFLYDSKQGFTGNLQSNQSNIESFETRNYIKEKSVSDFFNVQQKLFNIPVEIKNPQIDTVTKKDDPLTIKYDLDIPLSKDDIIYFTPLLYNSYKENPFKSAERTYPVEFPYCSSDLTSMNIEIPDGYFVDELPKSVHATLNDGDGSFDYIIATENNMIQLICKIKINKTFFQPEDYSTLRNFYTLIVNTEASQIVFKKITK